MEVEGEKIDREEEKVETKINDFCDKIMKDKLFSLKQIFQENKK